jgi:hypothetical protein
MMRIAPPKIDQNSSDTAEANAGAVRPGAALIAAMQASPHPEIEIEPDRAVLPVRAASL